jgi:hypothetical protein
MSNLEAQKGVLRPKIIHMQNADSKIKETIGHTASEINHNADYTSKNVPRNCSTEEKAREKRLKAAFHKTIHTNSRYTLSSVNAALQSCDCLAVKSDMNTGKTHQNAYQLTLQVDGEVSIVVAPLASLVRGTAKALENKTSDMGKPKRVVTYDQVNKKLSLAKEADCIVTTFNNLPKMAQIIKAHERLLNLLVFDEIESGAGFMANGTISNKGEAGGAIQELSGMAKKVLVMDAHLGELTTLFLDHFIPNRRFTLLHNTYQSWAGSSYSWLDGKDQGTAKIIEYLEAGKPVFVTTTSKELAKQLWGVLEKKELLTGKRCLKAFDDGRSECKELIAAKEDHSLFKLYDLVIASPTVGTGISIEGEHFYSVVSFMVRDKNAPDAVSAMQMPFRVRNPIEKRYWLVNVDNAKGQGALSEWQIAQDHKTLLTIRKQILTSSMDDSEKSAIFLELSKLHFGYEVGINKALNDLFSDYYLVVDTEFKAKGIELVNQEQAEVESLSELRKEVNAELAEADKDVLRNAEDRPKAEIEKIQIRMRYNDSISQPEYAALRRFNIVQAYHPDDSAPTPSQFEGYLQLDALGIATGRNNIARGLLSLKDINALTGAYHSDEKLMRDIASKKDVFTKAAWQIDRILCDLAGIKQDGASYTLTNTALITDSMLTAKGDGRSYTRMLSDCLDTVNAISEKRISRNQLYKEPAKVFKALLESRLKLDTKGKRGQGFYICAEQTVLDNLNMVAKRGSFGDLKRLDYIKAKEQVHGVDELVSELKIPLDIQEFLINKLALIPARFHENTLNGYREIATSPRPKGDNLAPLARANLMVLDAAEKWQKAA